MVVITGGIGRYINAHYLDGQLLSDLDNRYAVLSGATFTGAITMTPPSGNNAFIYLNAPSGHTNYIMFNIAGTSPIQIIADATTWGLFDTVSGGYAMWYHYGTVWGVEGAWYFSGDTYSFLGNAVFGGSVAVTPYTPNDAYLSLNAPSGHASSIAYTIGGTVYISMYSTNSVFDVYDNFGGDLLYAIPMARQAIWGY